MNSVMPKMRRRKQAGYTLLMVVFMVATLIIATAAVAPNLLTQGRREKEAEMVWRGQQYARAIGLYYLLQEFMPAKRRGLISGIVATFIPVGILTALIGTPIVCFLFWKTQGKGWGRE